MRRYFFDVVTPSGRESDEIGLEFVDLDNAYLEACRGVADITRDLLTGPKRGDPFGHGFEIFDEDRRLVLEVPFRELLNPRGASPPTGTETLMESLRRNLSRSQELKTAIAAELQTAQASMARIRARLDPGAPATEGQVTDAI